MRRLSSSEIERRATIHAHTFMFGCSGRSSDPDESVDATEGESAFTSRELEDMNNGMVTTDCPLDQFNEYGEEKFPSPSKVKKVLSPNEKTIKKRGQRKRKKIREQEERYRAWRTT